MRAWKTPTGARRTGVGPAGRRVGVLGLVLAAALGLPGPETAAANWTPPQTFASESRMVSDSAVTALRDGTLVFLWQEEGPFGDYAVKLARRHPSGAGTAPIEIKRSRLPVTDLSVVGDRMANVLATWCSGGLCSAISPTSTIEYAYFPRSGDPTTGKLADNGFQPDVAVDPEGRVAVVYAKADGIFVRSGALSQGPPAEATKLANTAVQRPEPAVSTSRSGVAVVLFADVAEPTQAQPVAQVLRAVSRSSATTSWTSTGQELDRVPPGARLHSFRVAVDPAGRALATWLVDSTTAGGGVPGSTSLRAAYAHSLSFGAPTPLITRISGGVSAAEAVISDSGRGRATYVEEGPAGTNTDRLWYVEATDGAITQSEVGLIPSPADLGAATVTTFGPSSFLLAARQGTDVIAAVERGGALRPSVVVGPSHPQTSPHALAVPESQDAVVAWERGGPESERQLQYAAYDLTPPVLSEVAVPARTTAGARTAMSARAEDLWTKPAVSWDFGGEGTGRGELTSHTFLARGERVVTLRATDAVGNTSVTTRTITVEGPVSPPSPSPPAQPQPAPGSGPGPGGGAAAGSGTPTGSGNGAPAGGSAGSGAPAGGSGGSGAPAGGSGGSGAPAGGGSSGGGGASPGTRGSSTGSPRRGVTIAYPQGSTRLRRTSVRSGYGLLCDAGGGSCVVRGVVRSGRRVVGRFRVTLAPGRTREIRFTLTRAGRRLLDRRGSLRLRIAAADVDGLPVRVTLKRPRLGRQG